MDKKTPPFPDSNPSPAPSPVDPADSFSERIWAIWQRRQKLILQLIGALLLGVLIWQGGLGLSHQRQSRIETAFQQLGEDEAAWFAFTENYPKTSQAGLAFLKLAHRRYTTEAYAEAAEFYKQAAERLPENPWRSRALLGQATAITLTDPTQGIEPLQALTEDSTILDSVRAQAAYNLAMLHWQAEAYTAVQAQIDLINQLEYAGATWVQKAQALTQKIPQLQIQE